MNLEELLIFPSFECYTGNSLKSFTRIKASLFSDRVELIGKIRGYDKSFPIRDICAVSYNNLRALVSNKLYTIILMILSITTLMVSLILHLNPIYIGGCFILILTIYLDLGEMNLFLENEIITIVGNKRNLKKFCGNLQKRILNPIFIENNFVDPE